MAEPGRPAYTDEEYQTWLDDMRPWLRAGNTLYYAMEKADLLNHQTTIYEKYRLGDWFSRKIDALRRTMGELVNNILFTHVEKIKQRQVDGGALTREDLDALKLVAEKHRTAQAFFVNRTETAEADPNQVGKILDTIEQTDYATVGQEASKQVVATDTPVQNKE